MVDLEYDAEEFPLPFHDHSDFDVAWDCVYDAPWTVCRTCNIAVQCPNEPGAAMGLCQEHYEATLNN